MPGLQSLVSAWVKVNQDRGEYFGDVSSVREAVAPFSVSAAVGQQQQQQQGQLQTEQPPTSYHAITSLSNVTLGQPAESSTSSLSTFTLSKGTSLATGATGASTTSQLYQPQEKTLPYSQLANVHSGNNTLVHQPQHASTLQRGALTHAHGHRPPTSLSNSHYHHVSYHPKDNPQPSHPQAGADAILTRRKSSSSNGNNSTISNQKRDMTSDGATQSSSNSSYRRHSKELHHSQSSVRADGPNNINMLSHNSEFEKQNTTHSLDRIRDGSSFSERHAFGLHSQLNSFGTNDTFRRDLNNMQRQESNRESFQMSNITDSSSDLTQDDKSSRSAAIPIPTSRNMFGRQKIKKTHSRTDLVREMALDRHRPRGNKSTDTLNGGESIISSNNNSPRRNSSWLSLTTSDKKEGDDKKSNDNWYNREKASKMDTTDALNVSEKSNVVLNAATGKGSVNHFPQVSQGETAVGTSNALQRSLHSTASTNATFKISPRLPPVVSTVGPSNLSKSLQFSEQVIQGVSSSVGPSNFSLDNSLGTTSIAATNPPSRNAIMTPGLFPQHSEQDHLMRASFLSRRSTSSNSTVHTGNLYAGQDPINGENVNVINQGSQQIAAPSALGATPALTTAVGQISGCNRCSQMESTLLSLQADVEYLRTLELQREFLCMECETSAGKVPKNRVKSRKVSSHHSYKPHPPSIPENPLSVQSGSSAVSGGSKGSSRISSPKLNRPSVSSIGGTSRSSIRASLPSGATRTASFLREASKRMTELSTRYKRQVQQSTRERAYWQNDMHLKLDKFAMMAKNLNEEAAKRNNEVKETNAILEKVTSERNALISQVEVLKARVKLYEEESINYEKMRKEWENEELQRLTEVETMRKEQDAVIQDLTSRLDFAIKTIKIERRQQHHRRQIMFPSSRQNSTIAGDNSPSLSYQEASTKESNNMKDLELMEMTSSSTTKKYQVLLKSIMTQSAAREKDMRDRLETMEQELQGVKGKNCSHELNISGSASV